MLYILLHGGLKLFVNLFKSASFHQASGTSSDSGLILIRRTLRTNLNSLLIQWHFPIGETAGENNSLLWLYFRLLNIVNAMRTTCQHKCAHLEQSVDLNIDGVPQIWIYISSEGHSGWMQSRQGALIFKSCFSCLGFKDFAPLLDAFKDFFIFFLAGMKVIICFWVTSQLCWFLRPRWHPRNEKWGVAILSLSASQHSEEFA